MGEPKAIHFIKKLKPYNVVKGVRYLRHFGVKEFMIRLSERMEPEEVPYGPWYAAYVPTQEELEKQRKRRFKNEVCFSLVVPAWKTPEKFLREMIESVQAQTYPNWELVLVNASPEDEQMANVLKEYTDADSRIRVLPVTNAGIAANTQAGLEAAAGDYICLLDHDDLLSPAALYQFMVKIEKAPQTDMLYTDEDKVEGDSGEHFQPHVKPDFNPDLLRSNNYITHFLCVKKSLALSVGGFRPDFDGAQDYDFILRCSEKAEHIAHVPEILYHWRTHSASTADNPLSKSYAYEAGRKALSEHLKRCGIKGEVELLPDAGFYRVHYGVTGEPLVSIIIPNKDQVDTLKQCLKSIREKTTWKNYEILVIENNSVEEGTFAYYKEIDGKDNLRVITWEREFNYSAINNFGRQAARGEYLVLLNNDIEVITPDWIQEMLGVCQREGTAAVGARLYYPDNTYQHGGIVIGIGGIAGSLFVDMKRQYSGYLHKAALLQDLSAVTAACMMVKSSAYDQVGGLTEKLAVAFNDVDFCLKLREQNLLVVYDPYVEMYHYESKTRGTEDTKNKVHRFQTEIEYMRTNHLQILKEGDPYYNKNLSLSKWNYSLKSGERMR